MKLADEQIEAQEELNPRLAVHCFGEHGGGGADIRV